MEIEVPQVETQDMKVIIKSDDYNNDEPTKTSKPDEQKKQSNEPKNINEKEEEAEEKKYDLNKDWKFLSIMQFLNVFHKVLTIDQVSTYELEFSLKHTDIEPLCANILSKLLMKKEIHRPSAKSQANQENPANNQNVTQGSNSGQQNLVTNQIKDPGFDISKLNEILIKKINFFYKTYIRFVKKIYSITDMSKIFEAVEQDIDMYKNRTDPFSLTSANLSDKFYDDLDTKTFLIIDFFRDLDGKNPLHKAPDSEKMEKILSNASANEEEAKEDGDYISFADLTIPQKVKFLFFFCNYAITISGRAPLYKEEISKSKEEYVVQNKKILPLCTDNGTSYYTFGLNKDCRIYKEESELSNPIESSKTFDIIARDYVGIEKLKDGSSEIKIPSQLKKKLNEKLLQFKTNEEEEKKKEQSLLRKQEYFEKAKKISTMNTNNLSEVEKYKNNDFLLMNISNHVITRNQLNQITRTSQQQHTKTVELTEEQKHKLKVERENLERERRMEKRNRLQEKMIMDEKNRAERAEKYANRKRNRDKKKGKKKYVDEEDEYSSSYEEESEDENNLKLESDTDEEYKIEKKKPKENNYENENDVGAGEEADMNDDEQYVDDGSTSDIINEGHLIYRYSNNQIEIEGNWYVSNDPVIKERISYLFGNSGRVTDVNIVTEPVSEVAQAPLNYVGNNLTDQVNQNSNINEHQSQSNSVPKQEQTIQNVKMCAANLFECVTVDSLLKACLNFLQGDYSGYFMYYGKTIEDRFQLSMEIQDSLVKCIGQGSNNLGSFNLLGYMNFYRTKEDLLEKNKMDDPYIKLAEFKMTKIYNEFNPTENNRVIKSYNHRRKKNDSDYLDY